MRVRTLSLSRTLMMWPSGLSSCERPEALVLGTSLRAWVRTPPSSLEVHAARSYPWPSWSKALDLSPNLSGGVGSNPTGCISSRETDWRNGSASDSSPEGYVFESRIGHTKVAGAAARSFPKLTRPPNAGGGSAMSKESVAEAKKRADALAKKKKAAEVPRPRP